MSSPLFMALSKDPADPYLGPLCRSSGGILVHPDRFDYSSSSVPVIVRGLARKSIIDRCIADSRDYYVMDTGYFANYGTLTKRWHRIVKNGVQHGNIVYRPGDRWARLVSEFSLLRWTGWKRNGSKVLLVVPSDKPCKFYGIDRDRWIADTIAEIKRYTDREIVVRLKPERVDRIKTFTIYDQLDQDIFTVVTYNSIAAVEAVAYGIPAFTLAPTAADPVCLKDLSLIESPYYPDSELVNRWCCHLAYAQYHTSELVDGTAYPMLF